MAKNSILIHRLVYPMLFHSYFYHPHKTAPITIDSLLLLENVFIKASYFFKRIYIFAQPKEVDAYLSSFVGNQPYQAICGQEVESNLFLCRKVNH